MFEWLKKKTMSTITESIANQPLPVPSVVVPAVVTIQRRKWVTYKQKVGIVVEVTVNNMITLDLVNERGETIERIKVPAADVKLARFMEIPESRRGDKAVAATLGYV